MKKLFAAALALTMALSLAACGTPGQAESPSNPPSPDVTASPSQTPELFTFTRENFPRLNGSTSTAPLGRALAAVLLGESEDDVADLINFSRTTASFRALMAGESDLLIVGEPNASVYDEMAAAKFEASIDTFANDGLVFVVNANNPVDSLTLEQLQGIYTGKITNWKEVGGEDLEIVPFQRNEDAGSQALMKKLVMGDLELMAPRRAICSARWAPSWRPSEAMTTPPAPSATPSTTMLMTWSGRRPQAAEDRRRSPHHPDHPQR